MRRSKTTGKFTSAKARVPGGRKSGVRPVPGSCLALVCFVTFLTLTTATVAGELSFDLKGNLTTSSQLFPNPNSSDVVKRAEFSPLEDFFGVSAEVRYHFPDLHIAIGLSADYINTTTDDYIRTSSVLIPVTDGYRVTPIELTGYFQIPISGPTFQIFMGGGVGTYLGRRMYRIGGVEAPSTELGRGYGIHILGGVRYSITRTVATVAEMKFRDLQFETSNTFSVTSLEYDGVRIQLPQGPQHSRVYTDGVIFQVGLSFTP